MASLAAEPDVLGSDVERPAAEVQDFEVQDSEVEKQLSKSQKILQILRWRVGCLWIAQAFLGGTCYLVALFVLDPYMHSMWAGMFMAMAFTAFCNSQAVLLIIIAPHLGESFCRCGLLIYGLLMMLTRLKHPPGSGYFGMAEALWYMEGCISLALIFRILLPISTGKVYLRMLTCLKLSLAFVMSFRIMLIVLAPQTELIGLTSREILMGQLVINSAALLIILRPKFLDILLQRLLAGLEGPAICRSAASIAGLIGNCQPHEVAATARRRFKSVRLADLNDKVLADGQPNAEYSATAEPCGLGYCDAFLSHSWHDDARAKWQAMQKWRESFVSQHGHEPSVWFDRCCIDQTRIAVDLRCLPVFLMGCSRLVLFCGPTYLSRLWCILELFTYIHMGGRVDHIEFVPVRREGHEREDQQAIDASFDHFDAKDCQCANDEDKSRILMVIQAAFGNMQDFNLAVSTIALDLRRQHNLLSPV